MENNISITVLVDNNAEQGFKEEHGFCVLIEHGQQRILFDTGQCDALFYNAKKLNINLTNLDAIILSHGHYDHGGNIEWLLTHNPTSHLYLHPDCLQKRYSIKIGKQAKDISLSKEAISAINKIPAHRITMNTQKSQITPSIFLSGEITKQQLLEQHSGPFYLDKQATVVDLLRDDQSIWIETKQGIVMITGCCHAGIENSVKQIQQQSSKQTIHTILGGLHLHNASENRLQHSADFLKSLSLKKLYPAHCSGEMAQQWLSKRLGENVVQQSKVGLKLTYNI